MGPEGLPQPRWLDHEGQGEGGGSPRLVRTCRESAAVTARTRTFCRLFTTKTLKPGVAWEHGLVGQADGQAERPCVSLTLASAS